MLDDDFYLYKNFEQIDGQIKESYMNKTIRQFNKYKRKYEKLDRKYNKMLLIVSKLKLEHFRLKSKLEDFKNGIN